MDEMTSIKAVIFDMDGVLIDAKEWHYESLNGALATYGFTINRSEHLAVYDGLPTSKKLELLSRERGFPRALHKIVNELKQRYTLELIESQCRPRLEHVYALARLRREGYTLAVASICIPSDGRPDDGQGEPERVLRFHAQQSGRPQAQTPPGDLSRRDRQGGDVAAGVRGGRGQPSRDRGCDTGGSERPAGGVGRGGDLQPHQVVHSDGGDRMRNSNLRGADRGSPMRTHKLTEMVGGWFVGQFHPAVLRTGHFETAVKYYQRGDREPLHHHKVAVEITVVASGEVACAGRSSGRVHYFPDPGLDRF